MPISLITFHSSDIFVVISKFVDEDKSFSILFILPSVGWSSKHSSGVSKIKQRNRRAAKQRPHFPLCFYFSFIFNVTYTPETRKSLHNGSFIVLTFPLFCKMYLFAGLITSPQAFDEILKLLKRGSDRGFPNIFSVLAK